MKILDLKDIKIHPLSSSSGDYLFYFEDKLYRCATDIHFNLIYKKIYEMKSELIQPLFQTNLKIKNLENFTVYEHKIYHHRVRIFESTRTMIQQYLKHICKLQIELLKNNLTIFDLHEGNINVTIDGIKWIDLNGIRNASLEDANLTFLNLSYFFHKYYLKDFGVDDNITPMLKRLNSPLQSFSSLNFLKLESWEKLFEYFSSLIPTSEKGHWSENYSNTMPIDNPSELKEKGENVFSLIKELCPETVTDIACNKGYFSFIASKFSNSVIGFDSTEACIDIANNFNNKKFKACFAYLKIEDIYNKNNFITERYKSELVLALAITHHITNVFSPKEFCKIMDSLSYKYILLEEINNIEEYRKELNELGYKLIKTLPSFPNPRLLSLYRK